VATVTYKNQPAIHKTRGAVPENGTDYPYTVGKKLWPSEVENYIERNLIGKTLHVCCGKSRIGDVFLDLNERDVNVIADAAKLPFGHCSFDTVLCDPPYNGKFQWNHDLLVELSRVAKKRIIFQHWFIPADKYGRYRKNHKFHLNQDLLALWNSKAYFGRVQVISFFDREQAT
jgi:16S rRNA G966 N2-methylase RsmD